MGNERVCYACRAVCIAYMGEGDERAWCDDWTAWQWVCLRCAVLLHSVVQCLLDGEIDAAARYQRQYLERIAPTAGLPGAE